MITNRLVAFTCKNRFLLSLCNRSTIPNLCNRVRNASTNVQVVRRFTDQNQPLHNCWSCQSVLKSGGLTCTNCGALSAPDTSKNYFELFRLSSKFNVDSTKLTENFRQLQSIVHPDKYSNKSDIEQQHSMDWSSLLNKAYSILSVPLKRGQYMLELQNIHIPERNETLNPEFLMEMMERNEELADLATHDDCNNYLEKLKNELSDLYKEFSNELESNELEKALMSLVRLRYINNLEKKVKEKLYELHD